MCVCVYVCVCTCVCVRVCVCARVCTCVRAIKDASSKLGKYVVLKLEVKRKERERDCVRESVFKRVGERDERELKQIDSYSTYGVHS